MTRRNSFHGCLMVALGAAMLAGCGGGDTPGKKTGGKKSGAPPAADETIAEGWGDLTIRFVYDGEKPQPMKLALSGADAAVCAKHSPMNESLVVGDNGGLANVFVFLRPLDKELKIHPDYEQLKGQPVKLVNKGCSFHPHVLTLWTEQSLEVVNDDDFPHNTNITARANRDVKNEVIAAHSSITRRLSKPEKQPMPFACNIHPWMGGHLLVWDNPYMGVSGKDGTLTIKNIPSGYWYFSVWHEKVGKVAKVKIGGEEVTWKDGAVRFAVKPGGNDVGDVSIVPRS